MKQTNILERLFDYSIPIIIAWFMTSLVTVSMNYLNQEKGYVRTGAVVHIDAQPYLPIAIGNYMSKPLDGLQLSLPASFELDDVQMSHPLKINMQDDVTTTSTHGRVELSAIEPNAETQLLFSLNTRSEATNFRVLNAKEIGLVLLGHELLLSPFVRAIRLSLVALAVQFVGVILTFLIVLHFHKRLEEKLETLRQEREASVSSLRAELKKEMKKTIETRGEGELLWKRMMKLKLLYLARIRDYTKELEFWRDTIRKLIYQSSETKIDAETLFSMVTDNLRTYQTRIKGAEDYDAVVEMAELLEKAERQEGTDAKKLSKGQKEVRKGFKYVMDNLTKNEMQSKKSEDPGLNGHDT